MTQGSSPVWNPEWVELRGDEHTYEGQSHNTSLWHFWTKRWSTKSDEPTCEIFVCSCQLAETSNGVNVPMSWLKKGNTSGDQKLKSRKSHVDVVDFWTILKKFHYYSQVKPRVMTAAARRALSTAMATLSAVTFDPPFDTTSWWEPV